MIPTWAAVVTALSLLVMAIAVIVVAVTWLLAARHLRRLVALLEQAAGPALQDVRALVATIKGEADSLVGTSRDIRLRIVRAADAAQERLSDLAALVDVVQEEVEETAIDAAGTLRDVRRGLRLGRLARRVLTAARKRRRR
jgi:hypothetical protein